MSLVVGSGVWRMLVILVVGLVALIATTTVASADTVTADVSTADSDCDCGASTEVTLTLTGQTSTSATPTDVVLVLDESGSLSSAQFVQMKNFALATVQDLAAAGLFENGGRVGLVMFATSARTVLELNGNQQIVTNAIGSVTQAAGATCIGCGVNTATQLLSASPEGTNRVMVVLTDGANNRPSNAAAFLAASLAAADAADILRVAVGVGTQVVQSEILNVAGDPSRAFFAANFDELEDVLVPIVEAVTAPGGTDIVVEATLADAFVASSPVASHGTASLVGNILTWNIDELADETATLTYTVTHQAAAGGGSLALHSGITYTDAEGNNAVFPSLSVDVHGCPADIALAPTTDESGGGTHTVTATVTDDFGAPVADTSVAFEVVSGPNAGTTGTGVTDAAGEAAFAYTGNGVTGDDVIVASFVNAAGDTIVSNEVTKTWADTVAPTLACAPGVNPAGRGGRGAAGFWTVTGADDVDGDVEIFIDEFGPFSSGTNVKVTVAPGASKSIHAGAGSLDWLIILPAEPSVTATDAAGNTATVSCS